MDTLNRTFIGLQLPASLIDEIEQALLLVKRKPGILDMKWSSRDEIVFIMLPLGELSVASMVKVTEHLSAEAPKIHKFTAEFAGFGGMPNAVTPRSCVLNFTETYGQALIRLVDFLERELRPIIPPRDAKPFHPNIPLGRLKTESEPLRVALGRALRLSEQPTFSPLLFDRLEMLTSGADHRGTHYAVRETFPLR